MRIIGEYSQAEGLVGEAAYTRRDDDDDNDNIFNAQDYNLPGHIGRARDYLAIPAHKLFEAECSFRGLD